jgi:hypothetical protein
VSTKFVQIKDLGSKLTRPQGVIVFPFMYIEKKSKKSSFKKPLELELRYLV